MDPRWSAAPTVLFLLASGALAQEPSAPSVEQPVYPPRSVYTWKWFETQKKMSSQFPSDYRIGGRYRLKTDIIVERGGTASRVSPYWVIFTRADEVEQAKRRLRDPQSTKQAEIEVIRRVALTNPRLAPWTEQMVRGIEKRRETQIVVREGTTFRFREIWLTRRFEFGIMIHAYAEMLDGPLQGQLVDIAFLSECSTSGYGRCNIKPEFVERVEE